MSWLHYLIEANIYLGVFYLCYCLFLNRDTHYTLGRVYLIFSCVIAFILPLTQLSILKPVIPEIEIEAPVNQVTAIPVNMQQVKLVAPVRHFTFDDAMVYLYTAGVVIAFLILLFRLRKLYILTRSSHSIYRDRYKLISLSEENTAFSFFNYLFIGSNLPQAETVIAHEMVHIRQKHSVDIIFMEILKVINWFNPFIYLTQRSLKTIHEYIADEQTAAQEQDTITYSSFLLNNAYGIQGASIAHSFFNYNLLKKRIIMLNKNRSGKLARLKYLAALPLCAGMLCISTLVFSKDYGLIDLTPRKAAAALPMVDSTKYTLQITDKANKLTATSGKMVFKNEKTGIIKTYSVNTLTKEDQDELLKERGIIIERVLKDPETADTSKLPPPPPPSNQKAAFKDFSRYVSIYTQYPKAAFSSKMQGNIIISFHVNTAGSVSDVKLLANPGMGFGEAVLSTANAYKGKIREKAGDYTMGVNFLIPGEKQVDFLPPSAPKMPNYVGYTHVLGLTDAQRKKFLPPPPLPPKPGKVPPPPAVMPNKPAKPGKVPPPPPAIERTPKVTQIVKPPVVVSDELAKKVKVDQIKLASPVVVSDEPAKKVKADQIRLASAVVVSDKLAKKVKVDQIKLASPVVIVSDEPAKKVKVDQIRLASAVVVSDKPAKKVKVDQIKLASPVVIVSDEPAKKVKVDQVKLASPVVVSDEPAKKVKVDQVKLASPVVVSDEPAKTPPVEKQK
jgi:TonB family protein